MTLYPIGPAASPDEVKPNPADLQRVAATAADALKTLVAGLGNAGLDATALRELERVAKLAREVAADLEPRVGQEQRDRLRVRLTEAQKLLKSMTPSDKVQP